MDNKKYRAPAVDKALDVLEYVSQAIDPISFSLLCKALGKSPNELFRVVNCLERRGFLLKDEKSNSYSLSLKLFELAHYHPPLQKLLHAASGPMAEFGEKIGLSSHLSVLENGDMVNLYEQQGADSISIHVKMGSRFPAVLSNSGKYLLALQTSDRLHAFLEQDATFQNLKLTEQMKLQQELKSLEKKKFWIVKSIRVAGVSDAILPLGSAEGGVLATFAVPFFEHLIETGRLIDSMQVTADIINRRLGLDKTTAVA